MAGSVVNTVLQSVRETRTLRERLASLTKASLIVRYSDGGRKP